MIALLLTVSLSAAAQVRIAPQLTDSAKHTYRIEGSNASTISEKMTYSLEQTYVVTSSTPDSAIIELSYANIQSGAMDSEGNPSGIFLGQSVRFSVNPNGTFRHLLNAKELRANYPSDGEDSDDEYLNYLFSDDYMASNLVNSPIGIFGKTITNGMKEKDSTSDNDLMMVYQLSADNRTVDIKSEPNDENITVTKQYVFGQDGWPTSFTYISETDMGEEMGKSTNSIKATLVE